MPCKALPPSPSSHPPVIFHASHQPHLQTDPANRTHPWDAQTKRNGRVQAVEPHLRATDKKNVISSIGTYLPTYLHIPFLHLPFFYCRLYGVISLSSFQCKMSAGLICTYLEDLFASLSNIAHPYFSSNSSFSMPCSFLESYI